MKLNLFLVPLAEPVCKAVFPPKIGPPQQGYFHGATYTEGLGATLLFAEGPFVSGGRSDLFLDISLLLRNLLGGPGTVTRKLKIFRSQKNG